VFAGQIIDPFYFVRASVRYILLKNGIKLLLMARYNKLGFLLPNYIIVTMLLSSFFFVTDSYCKIGAVA
jgi:hypothetical protein